MAESSQLENQLNLWDNLVEQHSTLFETQSTLFKSTVTRNAELESRNEELERELGVWKAALKEADAEKKQLTKSISAHQRSIDDNPLILCLIDGDGNIFQPDLIALGNSGGGKAATMLTQGILSHLDRADNSLAGRAKIWLNIYCNLVGLQETLIKNDACTAEQFSAFVVGFNQSSPLFSIVDVGPMKEAADAKLKECLRIFTRLPQIPWVFFGGGHDNGYATTLNYLKTDNLLSKIILLRGYQEIAYDLRNLHLPEIGIPGVFISHKMPNVNKSSNRKVPPGHTNNQSRPTPSPAPSTPQPGPSTHTGGRAPDSKKPLSKQRPPCNMYYLLECTKGKNKCPYSHDYVLSPEQVAELRLSARKSPCPSINKGVLCIWGDLCVLGHTCPRGPKCYFAKQGNCKYTGKHMHDPVPGGGVANSSVASTSLDGASDAGSISSLLVPVS